MALILDFKTENQLYEDFISVINQAFNLFSIQDWQIRQLKQAFKTNVLPPTVFLSILDQPQNGSLQFIDKKEKGVATRKNIIKQESTIRFSATRIEQATDTVQTYNGADILKLILGYMQTLEGIKYIKSLGYAQYKASAVNSMDFQNDSDNFQMMPYFDLTFLYTNSFENSVNEITKTRFNIYRI